MEIGEHYYGFMKKITITLDEEVALWARTRAAERNISISRLVGEMLREKMAAEENYQGAMLQYLSHPPKELKRPEEEYPPRQELHER